MAEMAVELEYICGNVVRLLMNLTLNITRKKKYGGNAVVQRQCRRQFPFVLEITVYSKRYDTIRYDRRD